MKLTTLAEQQGITCRTVRRWVKENCMPVPVTIPATGSIFINEPTPPPANERVAVEI